MDLNGNPTDQIQVETPGAAEPKETIIIMRYYIVSRPRSLSL